MKKQFPLISSLNHILEKSNVFFDFADFAENGKQKINFIFPAARKKAVLLRSFITSRTALSSEKLSIAYFRPMTIFFCRSRLAFGFLYAVNRKIPKNTTAATIPTV